MTTPLTPMSHTPAFAGSRVSPVRAGVVSALLAVAAGAFFEVGPPDVYGLCMACHGRDLIDWSVNALAGTRLEVAPASAVYPVLTTLGVLLGAMLGARRHGEFRWWTPEPPARTFVYGFAVMTCALIAGGCSIRLLLRTTAGDPLGLVGFGSLAAGVIAATRWLRWRATR
jgi:hypothetical protein